MFVMNRVVCPKFGPTVQNSDTLSKNWTPGPKLEHPFQSSDIYLSTKNLNFCTGKIILKTFCMNCWFCNFGSSIEWWFNCYHSTPTLATNSVLSAWLKNSELSSGYPNLRHTTIWLRLYFPNCNCQILKFLIWTKGAHLKMAGGGSSAFQKNIHLI